MMEADWHTLVMAHPDRTLTRRIVRHRADRFANGWSGRLVYGLLVSAEREDVAVLTYMLALTSFRMNDALAPLDLVETAHDAVACGSITEDEGQAWVRDLTEVVGDGHFFAAVGARP
jgi:hypothetical protein